MKTRIRQGKGPGRVVIGRGMLRFAVQRAAAIVARHGAAGSARVLRPGFVTRYFSAFSKPGGGGGGDGQKTEAFARAGQHDEGEQEPYDGGVTWKTFLPLAFLLGCGGAYYSITRYEMLRATEMEKEKERNPVNVATEDGVAQVQGSTGKVAIGGPWRLMDTDGKYVTNEDFKGQWLLMYFGFTYCPDICPNELMRMREILTILDQFPWTREKLLPLFATIDPRRDGPAQLKAYVADWHPRMIGLTGTQEECDAAAKAFRVYYSKSQLGNDPKDYLIDHSVMFYLIDPDGEFVDYYAPNATPSNIAERIGEQIVKFRPMPQK